MICAEYVLGSLRRAERYPEFVNHRGNKCMYLDLLIQIKNAQAVAKESIKTPYSVMDEKVLDILKTNRFIKDFEKKGKGAKRYFDIVLKYGVGDEGAIRGIHFDSKASRRVYRGYKDLGSVGKQGMGLSVISTSRGIMTTKDASKNKVGGQLLFTIW